MSGATMEIYSSAVVRAHDLTQNVYQRLLDRIFGSHMYALLHLRHSAID